MPNPLQFRNVAACALTCSLVLSGTAVTGHAQEPENETFAPIHAAFEEYREALLAADGSAATALLSANTFAYYDRMRNHSLSSKKADVLDLRLIDQVTVLLLRHRLTPDSLTSLDAESLVSLAVERGWIGEVGAQQVQLGTIEIDGRSATSTVRVGVQETPMPMFRFVEESEAWKLDLEYAMDPANDAFEQAAAGSGMDHEAFILYILSAADGSEVTASVWEPPRP